jgi:hypothetical protein
VPVCAGDGALDGVVPAGEGEGALEDVAGEAGLGLLPGVTGAALPATGLGLLAGVAGAAPPAT